MLSILSRLRRAVGDRDVAIDLGTANTRVYALGRGMVAEEPTVVRMNDARNRVESVGASALDRAPADDRLLLSPLRGGVVRNIDAAAHLLDFLLGRARRFGLIASRALLCAPTDASEDERAALREAMRRAGGKPIAIVPEPLAAAIGAQLDIAKPSAQMLVDIGDGVTDIAVIRSSRLLATAATRTACADLSEALSKMVREQHGVRLPLRECERLVASIDVRGVYGGTAAWTAAGCREEDSGAVRIELSEQEIWRALRPTLNTIAGTVRTAVRQLPRSVAEEVMEAGVCLTGGGACLRGMRSFLSDATWVPMRTAPSAPHAVINGARRLLRNAAASGEWPRWEHCRAAAI